MIPAVPTALSTRRCRAPTTGFDPNDGNHTGPLVAGGTRDLLCADEHRKGKRPVPIADILSIQLYTLRSLNDLDTILDIVAAAGFRNVEGVGSHLDDAANVKEKLDARGLKCSSSHVSLTALRERPDRVIAACKRLGFVQLFMPAVPPECRDMDGPGWRSLGRELGALAARFADAGVQLGYHNHNWELKPKDGAKTALELLFAEADGSPLTWQADVAWLARGGAVPEEWLHRYSDRLVSAHVKDIAPQGTRLDEDGWADVGAGVLDWRSLWQTCRDCGAQWMVVEHDKPSDAARSASASFTWLSKLQG
jgi:sugar phosphate isomerase/epimerase